MPRTPFVKFTLKSGYMPISLAKITLLGPKIAGIWGFLFMTPNYSKNARNSVIFALFTMPLKKVFRSTFCEISHILSLNIHIHYLESTPISECYPYFSSDIHIEFMETTQVSECQPYFWTAILIIFIGKRAILIRN